MASKTALYFKVKDHSVSGEEFELIYNLEFDMLETHPQPSKEKLSGYYQSEDYISHTDTKRNLFEQVYHQARRITLKRKLKLIDSFSLSDKNLLDVGCGTGDFLEMAKSRNWEITGIEPNAHARDIANKKTNDSVFDLEELLRLEKQSFDVITLWHVLEHLPRLEEHIGIFKSLLKTNGRLIIAVPNYKSYDAKFYKEFWAAYDVPRHFWHFSQDAISKLFGQENMQVERTQPMPLDAFYVSLLSEKYRTGWMNVFRAFYVGALSNIKARRSNEYSSLTYILKNN